MTISVVPSEFDVLSALRSFLLYILPTGVEVIRAYVNRVPEPKTADFVLMSPLRKERLETNTDDFVDTRFIGSISGTLMSVNVINYGTISIGSVIFGPGVADGTTVTGSAPGGYFVTPSQVTGTGIVMACGVLNADQPVRYVVQLDVHGPASDANAHIISTLFRDDYAYQYLYGLNPNIAPIHADDPKLVPFINAEKAYEYRWIVEAHFTVAQTVFGVPQQFFEEAEVTTVEVDLFPR